LIPAWGGWFFFKRYTVRVNGMNIAEVKKNAMTILSTNPFRMFISGKNASVLIG
jgi:hypothetical protein